jgi:hypothetical protein
MKEGSGSYSFTCGTAFTCGIGVLSYYYKWRRLYGTLYIGALMDDIGMGTISYMCWVILFRSIFELIGEISSITKIY